MTVHMEGFGFNDLVKFGAEKHHIGLEAKNEETYMKFVFERK